MDIPVPNSNHAISPGALASLLGRSHTPLFLDVRRDASFAGSERMLPLAQRVPPTDIDLWSKDRSPQSVIVYCVYGHEVSQSVASRLRQAGWDARYLLGGIEGGEPGVDGPDLLQALSVEPVPVVRKRLDLGVGGAGPSRWITRARPKIDRVACPWLIRRFVDRKAVFHYVPTEEVMHRAQALQAAPFDVPGAPISHVGDLCSFDALLRAFELKFPALDLMAHIVRGADTDRLDLAAPAAGLLAVSLGMSHQYPDDDHGMLDAMMPVYDALYTSCVEQVGGRPEKHSWGPL